MKDYRIKQADDRWYKIAFDLGYGTEEKMFAFFIEEGLAVSHISSCIGQFQSTIESRCRATGTEIIRLKPGENQGQAHRKAADRDWLEAAYKFGYKSDKEMLETLYVKKDLSSTEISNIITFRSGPAIIFRLKKLGIPIKTKNYGKGRRRIKKPVPNNQKICTHCKKEPISAGYRFFCSPCHGKLSGMYDMVD